MIYFYSLIDYSLLLIFDEEISNKARKHFIINLIVESQ